MLFLNAVTKQDYLMPECTLLIIHAKSLFASYLSYFHSSLQIASGSCNPSAFSEDKNEAKRFVDSM